MKNGFSEEDLGLDEIARCDDDLLLRIATRRPDAIDDILAHVRHKISRSELARRVRAANVKRFAEAA